MKSIIKFFKKQPLHVNIIIGLAAGAVWAYISIYFGWSAFTIDWIDPFGQIFINLLKLIAIPLVLFSIISGVGELKDISTLGRMGGKTLGLYLLTTVFSVSVGLILVNTFKPGNTLSQDQLIVNRMSYEMWVGQTPGVEYVDDKRLLDNPEYEEYFFAANEKFEDEMDNTAVQVKVATAQKKSGPLQFIVDMVPSNIFQAFTGGAMLQIIFFAIFFGVALVLLPHKKVKYVKGFVSGSNEAFIKMVHMVMKAAPFFVFALLAGVLAKMATSIDQLNSIFISLGKYALVVVGGLSFMIFIIYPFLVASIVSKKTNLSFFESYKYFLKGIRPAQLLAFSTSSSAATLPVTMECVHENIGVDEEVSSFVLPIGATVNMDGTSLYQAIAVIFLAQLHMIDLTVAQQFIIIFTATMASIGSAAIPSAGLIMLIVVLQSVNLNPAWIAIIFPIDRLLDMCRTVVNVTGDATVSTIVAQTENKLHLKT